MTDVKTMTRTFTPFTGNREKLQAGIDAIKSSPLPFKDGAFDMSFFAHEAEFGTVACLGGWSAVLTGQGDGEEWASSVAGNEDEWSWLFSPSWARKAPTIHDAIARTEIILTQGLPSDWRDQIFGPVSPMWRDAA